MRERGAGEDDPPLFELLRPGGLLYCNAGLCATVQRQLRHEQGCSPLPQVQSRPDLLASASAGQRALVASGGRGGRGNLAFKSARNTAPALAEFGEKVGRLWEWVAREAGAGADRQICSSVAAQEPACHAAGPGTNALPAGPCLPLTGPGDLD